MRYLTLLRIDPLRLLAGCHKRGLSQVSLNLRSLIWLLMMGLQWKREHSEEGPRVGIFLQELSSLQLTGEQVMVQRKKKPSGAQRKHPRKHYSTELHSSFTCIWSDVLVWLLSYIECMRCRLLLPMIPVSVCHATQLIFTAQKQLNRSRCCRGEWSWGSKETCIRRGSWSPYSAGERIQCSIRQITLAFCCIFGCYWFVS